MTGDDGRTVCCAGLSTSATMGSFWELSFKRNTGKSGACLVEGVTRMFVDLGNLSPKTICSKVREAKE